MLHRDLIVWQKSMRMAKATYLMSPKLPREETWGMRSQLTRAAASVPANIAEGWNRNSKSDKAHFLTIARGSLAETDTFLLLCEDIGWFSNHETKQIHDLIDEIAKMLNALIRTLRE